MIAYLQYLIMMCRVSKEQLNVFDNLEYQRQREKAYVALGSWKDQLDMIYHDIDAWKTEVKKIKDKYPKS